jgi:hypothetical protein
MIDEVSFDFIESLPIRFKDAKHNGIGGLVEFYVAVIIVMLFPE